MHAPKSVGANARNAVARERTLIETIAATCGRTTEGIRKAEVMHEFFQAEPDGGPRWSDHSMLLAMSIACDLLDGDAVDGS